MTIRSYLTNSSIFDGHATISEVIDGERPVVRLSETWFHPQGGGQKADRGTIGSARVTHVAHHASEVDHFVDCIDELKPGVTYPFHLDVEWRRLNMAYHTAGHLIAALVETEFRKLRAVAGHQWPGEARVEFEGVRLDDNDRLKNFLQHALNSTKNLPVAVVGNPFDDRKIQIGEYAPIPCGGTHVSNVEDLGLVTIDSVRKKSARVRVSYRID